MGFRFRKSQKVGPFRINMSQKGIGWSVGIKGLRYTKKADGGSRVTASIPGTGISYVTDSKKPTRKCQERLDEPEQKLLDYAATPAKEQPGCSASSGNSGNGGGKRPGHGCLWWIVAVLFWPISLSVWFWRSNAIASKKLKAGILAAVWVLLLVSAGNDSSTTTALPTSSSAAPSSVVVSSESATPEPEAEESSAGSDSAESLPASRSASSVTTAPTSSSQNSPAESNPTENISDSESSSSLKEQTAPSTSSISVAAPSTAAETAPAPTSSGSAASSKAPASPSTESESRTVVINPAETQQGIMVWITATGSKYHRKPNCGNTKNASEISLDRARALGYEPCKRCY